MKPARGPIIPESAPAWLTIPLLALLVAMIGFGVGDAAGRGSVELDARDWINAGVWLVRTIAIAGGIGVLATMLALPAAWASRRMGAWWWALMAAPLLLPQYLIYTAWGLFREPGTRLGAALESAPTWAWQWVGYAQALGGLALWSFPIAGVIVGASARRIEPESLDALRQTGAGPIRRWRALFAMLRPAILTAVLVVSMLMLGSAIPLHLARVQTYAVVIWRRLDESGWSPSAWALAFPLMGLALLAGLLAAPRLLRACGDLATPGVHRDGRGVGPAMVLAWLIWGAAVVLPGVALAMKPGVWHALGRFPAIFGRAMGESALTGACVALCFLLIAVGVCTGLGTRSRVLRTATIAGLYGWLTLAFVPGVLIGGALSGAFRAMDLGWMPARSVVIAAHLARYGAVAAVIGAAAHALEAQSLRDARRMLALAGLGAWWRSAGRLQAGLFAAAPIAGFALSIHEIEATVIAAPPGPGNLAEALLAKLHYLRDDELSAAALALLTSGILLGVIAGAMSSRSVRAFRRAAPLAMIALTVVVLAGCQRRDPNTATPIEARAVFGGLDDDLTLVYPRGIDTDGESLWIVDKSGWVSRSTLDGEPIARWKLPSVEKGFPVGITAGPDGLIYIADTHMHRVAVYRPTPEGAELTRTIGELGEGPGQFIYPTDVAIKPASDGVTPERIYVSEYGGNDRVSAFDGSGVFLFSFGASRDRAEAGQVHFSRPQSIVYDADRDELIVADAVDHRIGRFTADGELIAWIGREDETPGNGAGEFRYPYGLALREDGSLAVAEYGGCRVQIIDPVTGEGLGMYGTPGRGEGQLVSPWGVAAAGRDLFVLDSGNNRIMRFRPERAPITRGQGVAAR